RRLRARAAGRRSPPGPIRTAISPFRRWNANRDAPIGPRYKAPPRTAEEASGMKIVGFETNKGLRLGVVEGNEVIDLQEADEKAPSDLAVWLARHGGDLTPLKELAGRAPKGARRPL